ncbi:hypothetical protein NIES4101_85960 [Calothrix sp. NIES-4101]|nr:hypothetical protein NIES4101_85960 [Calothrix sp. NIES-4101]
MRKFLSLQHRFGRLLEKREAERQREVAESTNIHILALLALPELLANFGGKGIAGYFLDYFPASDSPTPKSKAQNPKPNIE